MIKILDCNEKPELLYELNGVHFFDNKRSSGIVVSAHNTNDETMVVAINTDTGDVATASEKRFGEDDRTIMNALNLMYGRGYSYSIIRPHESMGFWDNNLKAQIIRNFAVYS